MNATMFSEIDTREKARELRELTRKFGARRGMETYLRLRQQESLDGLRTSLKQMVDHAQGVVDVDEWVREYPLTSVALGITGGLVASKVILQDSTSRDRAQMESGSRGKADAEPSQSRQSDKSNRAGLDSFWEMIAEPVQTLVAAYVVNAVKQLIESPTKPEAEPGSSAGKMCSDTDAEFK